MIGVLEKTVAYVKETLYTDASGHDWWHIYRVWQTAKTIGNHYPEADNLVIQLSALLHDIADWKDNNGDFDMGPKVAEAWLLQFEDITQQQINEVKHIIRHISFKGATAEVVQLSLEGQIVQDADRLDAIGAMGIARTFAYGGSRGNLMYDPNIEPIKNQDEESYVHGKKPSTTINHFYEKLLLLKDRLNTEYGKELEQNRHAFMETYLQQFFAEWDGKR
jgi:uncharacterized protein